LRQNIRQFFFLFDQKNQLLMRSLFSAIPTRFLTPYREFEQRPHTPHWRQLDSNSRYGVRKYSRVTSTLVDTFLTTILVLLVVHHDFFLHTLTLNFVVFLRKLTEF
jgi:hypothetical protein